MRRLKFVRMTIVFFSTAIVILIWKISPSVHTQFYGMTTARDNGDGQDVILHNIEHPPPLKIVHLDLKGAPPKLSYLKKLLPLIIAAGGNALLLEYEDTFPYKGFLRNLSAPHAYSKDEILEFLSLCDYYNLEVIPLVQTFGHLEYILKLEEFMYLREEQYSPQEICPSNPTSLNVIEEMITQVLMLHQKIKRIHIGCDEVSSLNVCSNCLKKQLSSKDIFINHVKVVSNIITSKYPHVKPLIWDDMLRTWPANEIGTSKLNEYVEPVVWIYGPDILTIIPLRYWYWYFKHFPNIWIAGAFKGATDEMALVPDTRRHLENQESWLQFLSKHFPRETRISGYVLTGWSRYDHFAALCELLPVSTPSLILNLLKISSTFPSSRPVPTYHKVLKCSLDLQLNKIIRLKDTDQCVFPGQELIPAVLKLIDFREVLDTLYLKLYECNPWMTAHHLEGVKITNFRKVQKIFREHNFRIAKHEFERLCSQLRWILGKYFNKNTVDEWFLEHVQPYSSKMQSLTTNFERLRKYEELARFRGRQWHEKSIANTSEPISTNF